MANESPLPSSWQRWIWVAHWTFYVVLLGTMSFALALVNASWDQRAIIAILGSLLGTWYWYMIARHPQWWRQLRPMLIYALGTLLLWSGLSLLNPIFLLMIFLLYPHFLGLLPLPAAIVASLTVQTIWTWRQAASNGLTLTISSPLILIGVTTIIFNILLTLWISSVIKQSGQRQQLIEELRATRSELAASEHQAGVLAERQRLARDIHDALAQSLISIIMQLEVAQQGLPPHVPAVQQHLEQARSTARESLAQPAISSKMHHQRSFFAQSGQRLAARRSWPPASPAHL